MTTNCSWWLYGVDYVISDPTWAVWLHYLQRYLVSGASCPDFWRADLIYHNIYQLSLTSCRFIHCENAAMIQGIANSGVILGYGRRCRIVGFLVSRRPDDVPPSLPRFALSRTLNDIERCRPAGVSCNLLDLRPRADINVLFMFLDHPSMVNIIIQPKNSFIFLLQHESASYPLGDLSTTTASHCYPQTQTAEMFSRRFRLLDQRRLQMRG